MFVTIALFFNNTPSITDSVVKNVWAIQVIFKQQLNYADLKTTYKCVTEKEKRNLFVTHHKFSNFNPANACAK